MIATHMQLVLVVLCWAVALLSSAGVVAPDGDGWPPPVSVPAVDTGSQTDELLLTSGEGDATPDRAPPDAEVDEVPASLLRPRRRRQKHQHQHHLQHSKRVRH